MVDEVDHMVDDVNAMLMDELLISLAVANEGLCFVVGWEWWFEDEIDHYYYNSLWWKTFDI